MFSAGIGAGPRTGVVLTQPGQGAARHGDSGVAEDTNVDGAGTPVADPEALAAAIAGQVRQEGISDVDVVGHLAATAYGAERPVASTAPTQALSAIARPTEATQEPDYITSSDGKKRYEVVRFLAQGAQADIYLVRDPATGRLLVAKESKTLINTIDRDAAKNTQRMLREAQLLGEIDSPYVVCLYDAFVRNGERKGTQKFVMILEYVDGQSVLEVLRETDPRKKRQFRELELVRTGIQLGSGLGAMAAKGITHRDTSPGNIMVAGGGIWAWDGDRLVQQIGELRTKLLDLGVAHSREWLITTMSLGAAGTAAYMAPEQIHDTGQPDNITPETDLCGLGLVLISMALGELRTASYDDHRPELDLKRMEGRFSPQFIQALRLMVSEKDRAARRRGFEMLRRLENEPVATVPVAVASAIPPQVAAGITALSDIAPLPESARLRTAATKLVPLPVAELELIPSPAGAHVLSAKEFVRLAGGDDRVLWEIMVPRGFLVGGIGGFVVFGISPWVLLPASLGAILLGAYTYFRNRYLPKMSTIPIDNAAELEKTRPRNQVVIKNIRIEKVTTALVSGIVTSDVNIGVEDYLVRIHGVFDGQPIDLYFVSGKDPTYIETHIKEGKLINVRGILNEDGRIRVREYFIGPPFDPLVTEYEVVGD